MKVILILCVIWGFLYADECLDRAYILGVGNTKNTLEGQRDEDTQYHFVPAICGIYCTQWILDRVKETTLGITETRVNPAVDKLIESLRNQLLSSDTKIKELVHLKYVNALYSFYDKEDKNEALLSSNVDGCGEVFEFPATHNTQDFNREGILKEILKLLHYWDKASKMIYEKNMKEMNDA